MVCKLTQFLLHGKIQRKIETLFNTDHVCLLHCKYLCSQIGYFMIELKIQQEVCNAVHRLYGAMIDPKIISIENTKKEIEGDYTVVVFPLLKTSRKSPEITAKEIGTALMQSMPEIQSFGVIKGFLNLILTDNFWIDFLQNEYKNIMFGHIPERDEAPVVVEFSSPNTNKPLHLGHIRNNLLGHAVAEILKANGHKVFKVNLVNDRGIHICKSMLAYRNWGNDETPGSSGLKGDHLVGKYYVMFDKHHKEEVKRLMSEGLTEEDALRQTPLILRAQELLRSWESGDQETIALWKRMNQWTYEGFDNTYRRMGIEFDKTYYESETYMLGKELVMEGLRNGVLEQKEDGSVWADLKDDGLDEKLLLRSDGTSVYMTQDLGTARRRFDDFLPSEMIYVVGNEQNYHFDVLKLILKKLGQPFAGHIHHLSYGMVELPHGKMKSREGTVVDADDLMQEMYQTAEKTTREVGKADAFQSDEAEQLFETVGMGALKYFILKVDPKKNMLFDPVESIDFNGNTGPFIQYTYARIQSLLVKAGQGGHDLAGLRINHAATLLKPEKEMIMRFYRYPQVIRESGQELSPAILANYIFDLAKGFNQFYQEIPILKEDDPEKVSIRLAISGFTGDIIHRAMELMGIRVPQRM